MHPIKQAPSANSQAKESSSGYSTAPESAGSSTSVGSPCASAWRPCHVARIRAVLQARVIARLLRSSLRSRFRAWRGLLGAPPVRLQHRTDDELSIVSASSLRKDPRHGRQRKRGQRQARRPPDKRGSGSDASNEGRKGALGFNKDFPYINAKAACIKCGDGWMPGYWHRRARRQFADMPRHFDLLADKIMCDHCHSKYPLSPYYFPEYKPYVTEAEVERVRMESQADYIDLAKKAAAFFEEYCEQECKVPAAELDKTTAQLCPPAPARKLAVGSMVQLNSAGLMVESDYDWSTDLLAPGVHGTITFYNANYNLAVVQSTDSSQGADKYDIRNLEPARDVAVRMLTLVVDEVCDAFGECDWRG